MEVRRQIAEEMEEEEKEESLRWKNVASEGVGGED